VSQFLDCAVFQNRSSIRTTVFKEERGKVMGCGKEEKTLSGRKELKM
jgi:hypothetical protein